MVTARFALIVSLAAIACGPPRLASAPTDDDTETGEFVPTDSEESETSTSAATTIGFVPPNDALVSTCDPWLQDCAEGEKCVPYGSSGGTWDAHKCVPIMGDQALGEPCWWGGIVEATDNCDATSVCWNVMDVDGELIGSCHVFCMGTADDPECPEGYWCPISGSGTITLCIATCDPLLQDCGPGLGCFWGNGQFQCTFTTQDIPAGQPCGFINDCAAGLVCANMDALPACDGAACCTPLCELGLGDAQCAAVAGSTCVPFFEEGTAPPGYDDVGMCLSA